MELAKVDGVGIEGGFCGPGGGCDTVSIGSMGVSTTCGIRGLVIGSKYQIRIPSINFGKFEVAIIGLLTMTYGGKRNGIVLTRREPQPFHGDCF